MQKFMAFVLSGFKILIVPFALLVLSRAHEETAKYFNLTEERVGTAVVAVLDFLLQPLPMLVLGILTGLTMYPFLQRKFWPEKKPQIDQVDFASERHSARALEYRLKSFVQDWSKPSRSRGMTIRPTLKTETRSELVALLARLKSKGLDVPIVASLDDLGLALTGFTYLNGVHRLLDSATIEDAKTTSRALAGRDLTPEDREVLVRRLASE